MDRAQRWIVAGMIGLAAVVPQTGRADSTFRIRDRLAAIEVAEVTTVIVDGQTVASFTLDADHPAIELPVTVLDAPSHDFAFCGHLLLRQADGTVRKQDFDIAGSVSDVDGRAFEAMALDAFTRFTLVDVTESRPPAPVVARQSGGCAPATS